MASTYSSSLRLELMATGDQSGTWGTTTNTNLGTLLEQSITGYLSVAQGDVANLTLTEVNGGTDQARNAVVEITGALTAARNVVVQTAEKLYLIKNSTTGGFSITAKTTAGTGISIPPGASMNVYSDGTNVVMGQNYSNGSVGGMVYAEDGAAVGPNYDLFRDSASPAASDILGRVTFRGRNSAAASIDYAYIEAAIGSSSSTDEHGIWRLWLASAFTSSTYKMIEATGPSFAGVNIASALDIYSSVNIKINGSQSEGALVVEGLVNISGGSAGQIKFPATQNPSSNANTLDDYEEGTWTPTLRFGGATTGITYGTRTGTYTVIGKSVTINCSIVLTSKGSATGQATIITLPFTADGPAVFVIDAGSATMTGITTAGAIARVTSGTATIQFRPFTTTGTGGTLSDTNFTNTTEIYFSGSYLRA